MSLSIANHIVDEDRKTCARCGMNIPQIQVGQLLTPHRPGEIVGVIQSEHGGTHVYRPNPIRQDQDECEP